MTRARTSGPRGGAARRISFTRVGSFTHRDAPGTIRLRFTGRVHGRALPLGTYRLEAVPRNAAGAGRAVTRAFRIKRR